MLECDISIPLIISKSFIDHWILSAHILYHIISYHTTFAMAPIFQSSAAPHITKTIVIELMNYR